MNRSAMGKLTPSQASSYTLLLFFFFILLLASTGMKAVEGGICERRSKNWTGFCGNTCSCNSQCRMWETASHGACHAQFPGLHASVTSTADQASDSEACDLRVSVSVSSMN